MAFQQLVFKFKQVPSAKPKGRLTSKHVLMAIVSVLITGLVGIAVIVGMRIYTDSTLEILKVSL